MRAATWSDVFEFMGGMECSDDGHPLVRELEALRKEKLLLLEEDALHFLRRFSRSYLHVWRPAALISFDDTGDWELPTVWLELNHELGVSMKRMKQMRGLSLNWYRTVPQGRLGALRYAWGTHPEDHKMGVHIHQEETQVYIDEERQEEVEQEGALRIHIERDEPVCGDFVLLVTSGERFVFCGRSVSGPWPAIFHSRKTTTTKK